MIFRVFALLAVVPALMQTNRVMEVKPVAASVCNVVLEPQKFNGMFLSIRASVSSDGRHGIVLVDAECPKAAVVMDEAKSLTEHDDYKAFMRVLLVEGGVYGTNEKKRVSATFLGKPRYAKQKGGERVVLEVEKIENATVAIGVSRRPGKR